MHASTVDELLLDEVDFIEAHEPASHAKRRMDTNEIRSLLVVEGDRPIGLIQRNTLIRVDHDELDKPVSELMNTDFPAARQGESMDEVKKRIHQDINVEQIPVVSESGALVGAIDRHHLATSAEPAGGSTVDDSVQAEHVAVNPGMSVKDATGSKIGTVAEAEFKSDGGVEFFIVEHGLIFKKQKRLPGDLIREISGDDLLLALDETEFGMMRDIGEEA